MSDQRAMPWWQERPADRVAGPVSADRARTLRRQAQLEAGVHPLMRGPVNRDETCGSCAHLEERVYAKTYFKCALYGRLHGNTGGPATDVRKRWPACSHWRKHEEADTRKGQ